MAEKRESNTVRQPSATTIQRKRKSSCGDGEASSTDNAVKTKRSCGRSSVAPPAATNKGANLDVTEIEDKLYTGWQVSNQYLNCSQVPKNEFDHIIKFMASVRDAYYHVQPNGDNLRKRHAAEFANALRFVLNLDKCPTWNKKMGALYLCRSLEAYLLWLWALVPLKVLWAQIEAWCWGDVNTADVVVPVWWLGNGILQVLAMSCTPESRMAIGLLHIDHLRKAHPKWHEEGGAVVTSLDQLKEMAREVEGNNLETLLGRDIVDQPAASPLSTSQSDVYIENQLDYSYKPFNKTKLAQPNKKYSQLNAYTDFLIYKSSIWEADRLLAKNPTITIAERVKILKVSIKTNLNPDESDPNQKAFILKLQACESVDDIEACLWDLVSPAEIMAKYWYWCHPLELPDDVLAKLSPQPLYEDSVNMPFWNQCHGYLLRVAKANTLQQAQAEGEIAIPLLKKLDPNWATPRGPELLVHDVCQMFPTVELSANNFRQAKMMHLLKQPPPMWGELYDTMTR